MKPFIAIPVFLLLFITCLAEDLYARTETVVVIVHKDNPTDNLSNNALARIYKGRLKRWGNGKKIVILNRPIKSEIRFQFYKKILKAVPTKRFRPPKSPIPFKVRQIKSDLATIKIVARIPNAIGYVYLSEVDDSVKILRIDGLDPADDHYQLR